MWREFAMYLSFAICVLYPLSTNAFLLQSAPAALTNLATSASAYASSPPEQPITHIANLRKKQQKAEQLQSEKLLIENDPADSHLSLENGNDDDNEAAPSLFQKKLGKILIKLRLLSSLTGASSGNGGGGDDGNETDETETLSTNTNETTTDETDTVDKDVDNINNNIFTKNNEEATSERIQTFQKLIYPHSNYGTPLKVSFDINERIVNQPQTEDESEQSQNLQEGEDMGKLGQIGVFFAEILGSIVGLVYGAAAHITSGAKIIE